MKLYATVAAFLGASSLAHGYLYFTGGPITDSIGGTLKGGMATTTSAIHAITVEQRAEVDDANHREMEKLAALLGKETSVDLRGPLTEEESKYRAELDAAIAEALARDPGSAKVALIMQRQAEAHRRIRLFYQRQEALVIASQRPMGITEQFGLWSEIKTMSNQLLLLQLEAMAAAQRDRLTAENEKTELLRQRSLRRNIDRLHER